MPADPAVVVARDWAVQHTRPPTVPADLPERMFLLSQWFPEAGNVAVDT